MNLFDPQLTDYLTELARHGDPVLERLEKQGAETHFPIIGPPAGQFCYLVARLIRARRIFELGSGFGYSTLWFARAVRVSRGTKVASSRVMKTSAPRRVWIRSCNRWATSRTSSFSV